MATVSTANTNARWELANRLVENNTLAKQCVEAIFESTMREFQRLRKSPFDAALKQRVWAVFSPDPIQKLHTFFVERVYGVILTNMEKKQIEKALDEHKKTGKIEDAYVSEIINLNTFIYTNSIKKLVASKAVSMKEDWIPVLKDALRKEGVIILSTARSLDLGSRKSSRDSTTTNDSISKIWTLLRSLDPETAEYSSACKKVTFSTGL